jgi:hypothetical protein
MMCRRVVLAVTVFSLMRIGLMMRAVLGVNGGRRLLRVALIVMLGNRVMRLPLIRMMMRMRSGK